MLCVLTCVLAATACKPQEQAETPAPAASEPVKAPAAAAVPQPVAGPRERPPKQAVNGRDEAVQAVATGNPEGAADFLRTHITENPGDVPGRLLLAEALSQFGAFDEARTVLEDEKGKPADPRVLEARSRLAWRRGDLARTERLLDELAAAAPDALVPRALLLRLRTETGRGADEVSRRLKDELYDAYDAGRASDAEGLYAVALAALARGGTGAFTDANMVLEEAEELAPLKPGSLISERILLLRGAMFLQKYAREEAVATYRILLEQNPWHPDALAGMARAHMDGLAFGPASRAAQEAIAVNPSHPEAQAILARIALIEGRRDEARRRATKKVLTIDRAHAEALAVMAALGVAEHAPADYERWEKVALGFDAENGRFYRDLADILAFLHHYEAADDILARAVERVPRDPHVQSAYGLNLLRVGDEAAGLAALRAAWKRDRFNERTDNILKLYEERIDTAYDLVKVGDLTIRLPKEDRAFVEPRLVAAVERAREALDHAYGMKAGALQLEFFSHPDEFSVRTIGVPSLGAAAVCFGKVITFVGPYFGTHNLDAVIWHELSHVYAIEKSDSRVPRWFTEGLSEWESETADPAWARESAELLLAAYRRGKLRKLHELELAFIRAESPQMMEVAYSLAAYAVRYLGETHGRPKLIAMLEGYARGSDTETLVKQHLGSELAVLEREFEAWLLLQLGQKVRGWAPTPGPPDELKEKDRLYVSALEKVQAGQHDAAAATLTGLIAKGGDGYMPRLLLGRLQHKLGKTADARKHLERARSFHAEAVDPLVALTAIDKETGDVRAEIEHLEQALEIDANALDPAARLILLAEITGKKKVAARALTRAGAIAPVHPMVLSARALELARAKKKKQARAHLDRALEALKSGRGPADTFVIASLAARALGDRDKADILAARARQDPELPREALDAMSR